MKRRTILVAVAAVVILAAAGAGLWLYRSIDGLVAREIEAALERTTGTECSVGSVTVKLRTGEGTIRRLKIGNPKGFSPVSAVEIGEVRFALDVKTLRSKPVLVKDVAIDASSIHFEVDPAGKANLDEIRRHASSHPPPPPDAEPVLLRVQKLSVGAGVIEADLSAMGGKTERVELDAFTMRDVGGRNGATPDAIAQSLVTEVTKQAGKAVAREGLMRAIDDKTGGLGSKLKGLFKKD